MICTVIDQDPAEDPVIGRDDQAQASADETDPANVAWKPVGTAGWAPIHFTRAQARRIVYLMNHRDV